MKIIRFLSMLLIVIGAVNWGLWGLFKLDLIQAIVGSNESMLARLIYVLVGIAGVYGIAMLFNGCLCSNNCTCRKEKP